MITPQYAEHMAAYNVWQNRLLYDLADAIGEDARRADCGMCFGSIHNLFSHMLWDDMMLMHCLAATPRPEVGTVRTSIELATDWPTLRARHSAFSDEIARFTKTLTPAWLAGNATWASGAAERTAVRPRAMLLMQLFNHQTHHRGQLHVMLSQQGAKTPHTDLSFMPGGSMDGGESALAS